MFCLFVCLFICPLAYLKNHMSKLSQVFCTCCLLPWQHVAVASSSSDGSAMRYVLPVLWMTSCFACGGNGPQSKTMHMFLSSSPGGGAGAECAISDCILFCAVDLMTLTCSQCIIWCDCSSKHHRKSWLFSANIVSASRVKPTGSCSITSSTATIPDQISSGTSRCCYIYNYTSHFCDHSQYNYCLFWSFVCGWKRNWKK